MQTQGRNPCPRCGKERVVVSSWKEKLPNSTIVHTETACPDPECQKVVDAQNSAARAKRVSAEEGRSKAEAERKLRLQQVRQAKA